MFILSTLILYHMIGDSRLLWLEKDISVSDHLTNSPHTDWLICVSLQTSIQHNYKQIYSSGG